MAKDDLHDNVFTIGTGERLRKDFKRRETPPQQLEIINMLNQRKHQMKDVIVIWTEHDDDPDPRFITTSMSSVERLGMLHHVAGIINSFTQDVEEDDGDDEDEG